MILHAVIYNQRTDKIPSPDLPNSRLSPIPERASGLSPSSAVEGLVTAARTYVTIFTGTNRHGAERMLKSNGDLGGLITIREKIFR